VTQWHSVIPPPVGLEKLIRAALQELVAIGFGILTVRRYRATWNALLRFARERSSPQVLSDQLLKAFLESRVRSPLYRRQLVETHLRRLEEFAEHGRFLLQRRKKPREPLPPAFAFVAEKYLRFLLEHRGLRRSSLRHWERNLREFLLFLDRRRVRSLPFLRPSHFSDYLVTKAGLQPTTLADIAAHLRGFLRYLFMAGILSNDLSPHVPRIRKWRHDRLPAVWSAEQVGAMLAAIDRTSPLGKRNYAIVLLACRLGLRTCDIRALCLDDIRWEEAKITIRQAKTGVPLVLPLSEEVGQALIDYLKHGRPESRHREVFLSAHPPFRPFGNSYNFHDILTECRRRAGIKVPREGHWGMHSLRHTLATRLLEHGTPLPVISDILGHCSMESTLVYTKVDIPALRGVALDPEEVLRA
jgi:integrase